MSLAIPEGVRDVEEENNAQGADEYLNEAGERLRFVDQHRHTTFIRACTDRTEDRERLWRADH
jgi:hypothetical protein